MLDKVKELLKQADKYLKCVEVLEHGNGHKYEKAVKDFKKCYSPEGLIEALAVELNTFIESNGWQDISTAKKGKFVLLRSSFEDKVNVDTGVVFDNKPYLDEGYTVTHWQPLPSIKSIKA